MSSSDTFQQKVQREISDLTNSISGMVSSFKQLQRPLVESRETVPKATSQLDKISKQTEAVTTRMLDVVDQITQREEEVIRGLETVRDKAVSGSVDGIKELATDLTTKAGENLDDAYQIMESLQFQDITAQQMDHAASLLEEVEDKLHGILRTLGAPEAAAVKKPAVERKVRAYDPHAEFGDKKTDQKDIDSLFEKQQD